MEFDVLQLGTLPLCVPLLAHKACILKGYSEVSQSKWKGEEYVIVLLV